MPGKTVLTFLTLTALLAGQNPDAVIRSDVREVLLDVVVRHKDMSLATKLKVSDFTITEDGVPQTIKTFRFAGGRNARIIPGGPAKTPGPAAKPNESPANSLREPNFVSIVFGEMGPDSRRNAIEAATDFLNQEFQTNTYAAIFGLNLRLNAIHGFSSDRAALAKAVVKAVNGNSMELAAASANILNQTDYSITGGQGGVSINSGIDPTTNPDLATSGSSAAPFSEANQAVAAMISSQRGMVSNVAGMWVMTALLRLVQYESRLPGRKTVLYLSEGLVKPPGRADTMRAVISAANRGNISFYCLDVRGLTVNSSNGMAAGLTQTAAGRSRGQSTTPASPGAAKQQMQEEDLLEQSFAAQTQLNMAELAEGTGGFAIFNTNNFGKNVARVMEDVRTHYEISYTPTSSVYDGHFRQINVTVKDPNLKVQSRDGYFAVPDMKGPPVLPYEMAGLNALNRGAHRDFDFRVAALRFKPLSDGYRYEMGFELDTANLTALPDSKTKAARLHATFVALIKDARGQIVTKVSQEIDRDVPADKLDQFRRGKIIFTAPFEAVSGRYLIDAVVTDPEGNRASTKRLSLVVPKPGLPTVSNIAIVHTLDPLDAPRDPGNPLEFAGGKVMPALTQSVQGSDASLFFVVYPGAAAEKPKVTIEFFLNGNKVSATEPDIGSPDEVNSYPVVASAKLPPGDYTAKVTVVQGGRATEEATALTVSP